MANGMVEAIERMVQQSGLETNMIPDYVSMLGTLRACQQQTAAFRWAPLYESVEWKLKSVLLEDRGLNGRSKSKRRKIYNASSATLESLTNRNLPFSVLQSLIMWLQSLQNFPEHRMLHLRCDSGISTVVVWCHHLLGLTVTTSMQGGEICFGEGVPNILVEESDPMKAGACLMDPADHNEPLFSLFNDESSPNLSCERRFEASGCGLQVLKYAGLDDDTIESGKNWVVANCLDIVNRQGDTLSRMSRHPSESQILGAARFLFASEVFEYTSPLLKKPSNASRANWSFLMALLLAFARIDEVDLMKCAAMPLSLSAFQRAKINKLFPPTMRVDHLQLIDSFQLLSRLLLGSMYSEDYVQSAVLISAWGWSIFLDVVNAIDPTDVSTNSLRVVCGVPARRGLRRNRIIDGPTELRISFTNGESLSQKPQVIFFPGVSTAQKGIVMIGHHSDAFQVTQTFDWRSMGQHERMHKLGFREVQEMCAKARILDPCEHDSDCESFQKWLDKNALHNHLNPKDATDAGLPLGKPFYEFRWAGDARNLGASSERVFINFSLDNEGKISNTKDPRYQNPNVWYFYVTDNPAARLLQLDDLCNSHEEGLFTIFIRSHKTCLRCATDRWKISEKDALVLL